MSPSEARSYSLNTSRWSSIIDCMSNHFTCPNTKQYKVTPIAQTSVALPLYLSRVAGKNKTQAGFINSNYKRLYIWVRTKSTQYVMAVQLFLFKLQYCCKLIIDVQHEIFNLFNLQLQNVSYFQKFVHLISCNTAGCECVSVTVALTL